MRRLTVVLLTLLAVLVAPTPASAVRTPKVVVEPTSVLAGDPVDVSVSGFTPRHVVRLSLAGAELGRLTTDRRGVASGEIVVPADAAPGEAILSAVQQRPHRVARTTLTVEQPPVAGAGWAMDRVTASGAGVNSAETSLTAARVPGLDQVWEQALDTALYAPPVTADGVAFQGSSGPRYDDGSMTALDIATGRQLWRTDLPGSVTTTPAVADGIVVVPDTVGWLTALSTDDGHQLWALRLDQYGVNAPVTIDGGTVYVGADEIMHAIDLVTGVERWTADPPGLSVYTAPAVADGVVYAVATQGIAALDATTGQQLWGREIAGLGVYGSPAVVDGTVYLEAAARPGMTGGAVHALDAATGATRWSVGTPAAGVASPAVSDGVVFAATNDGVVLALDAGTGAERWHHQLPGRVYYSSPVLAADVLYIGADDATVHALDPATGDQVGSVASGAGDSARPVIDSGHLLVASESGTLRAFR